MSPVGTAGPVGQKKRNSLNGLVAAIYCDLNHHIIISPFHQNNNTKGVGKKRKAKRKRAYRFFVKTWFVDLLVVFLPLGLFLF